MMWSTFNPTRTSHARSIADLTPIITLLTSVVLVIGIVRGFQ
jgi:hypothetical protein